MAKTRSTSDGRADHSAQAHRPFYHVGGTVPRDAGCYVTRAADCDLLDALRRGDFCYVLTARQMGKSSLMTRAAARLREEGAAVAVVDLTAFGRNLTPEQWYDLILARVGRELELEDEVDAFWLAHDRLAPLARFTAALEYVVLRRMAGPVVLFIDEIDVVRSLPFDTDELFAAIREFCTRRAREPELRRLSFCLLGVASPADLIADARITPFNIGTRIELRDFTADEAAPLAAGLALLGRVGPAENGRRAGRRAREETALLDRVLHWTGGHPYLTQRLCSELVAAERMKDESRRMNQHGNGGAELLPPSSGTFPAIHSSTVDAACARLFFDRRAAETEDNLRFVADRLLRSGGDVSSILDLYSRALQGHALPDDDTDPVLASLRLSGVVRMEGGRLRVRNRIYGRVFDRAWIERQREPADLRRQRQAYRRGRNRALALAGVVAAVMGALVLYAFGAAQRATKALIAYRQAADDADRASYTASLNLIQREFEGKQFGHVASLLEDTGRSPHRGWEWGYWQRQMHQERLQLLGHTRPLRAAAWSPEGRRLITISYDNTARVWDAASGREDSVLRGHEGALLAAAWSPDGRRIVTASGDGTARVWDTAASGPAQVVLAGHQGAVFAAAWSPDGRRIVTASNDHTGRVWDAASGRPLTLLAGHTKPVHVAAWAPDGRRIVTAAEDDTARVWDAAAPAASLAVLKHAGDVRAAAWAPDGNRIATASSDQKAQVWDAASGRKLLELRGHTKPVLAAVWSPDGRRIVTTSDDHAARVWDATSGRQITVLGGDVAAVRTAAWSPDSRRIVTAMDDFTARVWDAASGEVTAVLKHTEDVLTAAWSPDGRWIVTTGDSKIARIWEATPRPDAATLSDHKQPLSAAAWSPDGRRILTTSRDYTARVWDASGKRVTAFGGTDRPVLVAAWSPDGRQVATASFDRAPRVWEAASGREATLFRLNRVLEATQSRPAGLIRRAPGARRAALVGPVPELPSVAWSPDGQRIVTAGCDDTARVWEVTSGEEVSRLRGHTAIVFAAAWSPDGKHVVTAGGDITARIWEIASGSGYTVTSSAAGAITTVVWSPDGKRIATTENGDNKPRLWHQPSGRRTVIIDGRSQSVPASGWSLLATCAGHAAYVHMAAFSANGQRLLTASDDHTARVWDAATGQLIAPLKGHAGAVLGAVWSPDGKRILTASEDHTARVWDAVSGRELVALQHPGPVRAAAWSPDPDGRQVITACDDGKARVWTSDPNAGKKGAGGGGPLR
jgi:WD40 repeat protein